MSYVVGLKCRECGQSYEAQPIHVCDLCFGPLEVAYDYDRMAGRVTRASIEAGPHSLWRYRDLLPVEGDPRTGAYSGLTPLRRAHRLEKLWGCREIYLKDDSVNPPTLSYKERVVSVAVSKGLEFGFEVFGCASTGNLANSVAAHAAFVGKPAYVMIPHDLEQGKVLGSLIYRPRMVRIRGNYDDVNRLCAEIADKYRWAIVNVNLRPFYTEGAKTFGFEVAEQLGWRLPEHIVVPTAGGTILPKVWKGFREFVRLGLVEDTSCRVYCAQAAGCDPVVRAIHRGTDLITPQKPDTLAKSIAIGNPADGYYVCEAVKASGGWAESVTDDEIVEGIKTLAEAEGLWTEPAGGTTVAVTRKLIDMGRIPRDESIVISITGQGLKTTEAVCDRLETPALIDARLSAFDALVEEQRAAADPASVTAQVAQPPSPEKARSSAT